MSKPVNRLGRGLSGIIGSSSGPFRQRTATLEVPALPEATDGAARVREAALDAIVPNPRQPRTHFDEPALAELAASIRTSGIVQPLLVRPIGDGRYELVAGERRWRAARIAGLRTVPVLVRELEDSESLEIALIENLQREDLGPLERATAYQQYVDAFRATPEALANRLGESRANVVNYLRILRLAPEIQDLIRSRQLGMGQARAIAGIPDAQRQLAIARLAARRNLSVRQVEDMAKAPAAASENAPVETTRDRHLDDVERSLSKSLGLAVSLQQGRSKNSGRIVIRYNSLEEFDRIAERIGGRTHLE